MIFDKEHLVDIPSLTEDEAYVFLGFLEIERARHKKTADGCADWCELWDSELKRQIGEVKHIDRGIAEVNKKFGWEEK